PARADPGPHRLLHRGEAGTRTPCSRPADRLHRRHTRIGTAAAASRRVVACARPELRLAELMSRWHRLLPTGHAIAFLDSLLGRGVLLAGPDAARAEA